MQHERAEDSLQTIILPHITYHIPYLQDQGHTCREEGHEDKVIGEDRHTAKTTHDL